MATDGFQGSGSPDGPVMGLEGELVRPGVGDVMAERNALLERQRRIMELIGTSNPEHLIHDIRNLLNELNLLRALTEGQE